MMVGETMAIAVLIAPAITVVMRATSRIRVSSDRGATNRLYRSCDSDVVIMNSAASAALSSAENTAARPSAPIARGRPYIRIVGSARSGDASCGKRTRAIMPSSTGMIA